MLACFFIALETISGTNTSLEVYATLYCQLVGSLLYLTLSRPNLSLFVGCVARYMQTPHESHWKAAKRILRYIRGTIHFGIHYTIGGNLCWLVSLIKIGPTILMIESLL